MVVEATQGPNRASPGRQPCAETSVFSSSLGFAPYFAKRSVWTMHGDLLQVDISRLPGAEAVGGSLLAQNGDVSLLDGSVLPAAVEAHPTDLVEDKQDSGTGSYMLLALIAGMVEVSKSSNNNSYRHDRTAVAVCITPDSRSYPVPLVSGMIVVPHAPRDSACALSAMLVLVSFFFPFFSFLLSSFLFLSYVTFLLFRVHACTYVCTRYLWLMFLLVLFRCT